MADKIATREAYGQALVDLADKYPFKSSTFYICETHVYFKYLLLLFSQTSSPLLSFFSSLTNLSQTSLHLSFSNT